MSVQDHNYLRAELSTQLYEETYEHVLRQVRADLAKVDAAHGADVIVNTMQVRRRAHLMAVPGGAADRAGDPDCRDRDSIAGGTEDGSLESGAMNSHFSGYFSVGKGKQSKNVNPLLGTMGGVCIIMVGGEESKGKFFTRILSRSAHLQTSWYELDGKVLWKGSDKERDAATFKRVLVMSDVLFIRDYTTDERLNKEVRFALEIETEKEGVIALGCETAHEKDCWLTAFNAARENAFRSKMSQYRLVTRDLTLDEFRTHAEMFVKQGQVYFSVLAEGE